VRVASAHRQRGGLRLELELAKGRRGKAVAWFTVTCRSVLEIALSDLNGGGCRVYSASHPAGRQYGDAIVKLSFRPGGRMDEIGGAVARAHQRLVEDWIPLERYARLDSADTEVVVWRGPAFLMRAYAAAIRALPIKATLGTPRRRLSHRSPRVLHLGDSYVVAHEFTLSRK
jgi:hypothetical protein